jgi:hypothetical protein
MACSSCGKNVSQRVGSTANTAIVFGAPTNQVIRVRVVEVPGMIVGSIKYVRGEGVQHYLDTGALVALAGGTRSLPPAKPGAALYYVGEIGYPDMGSARVRASQTGEEIVVRTL